MKAVFLFIFSAIALKAPAQPHTDYQNGHRLDSLRKIYLNQQDHRTNIENKLKQLLRHSNNQEFKAYVELILFTGQIDNNPSSVDALYEQIDKKYHNFPNIKAMSYQTIGYYYFLANVNYEKSFNAYLKLEKLLDIYDAQTITDYANYCSEIATAYYKFRNYKKAIELGKKGLLYAHNKWDFYNTIGLCYLELHQRDSSVYYLKNAVTEAENKKMPNIYRTIAMGNIGYNYYLQKQYAQAKPLIQADLNEALKTNDYGLAAGAAIPLADIYLAEKNWATANTLLTNARTHIAVANQLNRLEKFFPVRSHYYQLTGKPALAIAYRDSAIQAIRRNDSVYNGLMVMRVQQRTDMENLAEEKSKLENYKKLSQTRLWAISTIFILSIVIFLLIRHYRNRMEKDKKRIAELNRTMQLRQNLSADMHDDIGSTLSSIAIYTHALLMQPQPNNQKNTLEKIKQNAQTAQQNISDIIWSVNPNMDSIAQTITRMRAFGADMAEYANITFHFAADEQANNQALDMQVRKNLYLIYKEAINNAVKYSQCKTITVQLSGNGKNFTMHMADDGLGFNTSEKHLGNGLINMQRRANEIKATLTIASSPQSGTSINLVLT